MTGKAQAELGQPLRWEALCICGSKKKLLTKHLVSGKTKSCGCAVKDAVAAGQWAPTLLDLNGATFGLLAFVRRAEADNANSLWRCACGKEVWRTTRYMLSGRVLSCGCLSKQRGPAKKFSPGQRVCTCGAKESDGQFTSARGHLCKMCVSARNKAYAAKVKKEQV